MQVEQGVDLRGGHLLRDLHPWANYRHHDRAAKVSLQSRHSLRWPVVAHVELLSRRARRSSGRCCGRRGRRERDREAQYR
jgi:hypothetical protein